MLQKAEALAEALGDDKKSVHIRSVLGSYFIVRGGDPQLGWKYLERCAEDSEKIQDVDLLIPVGVDLCTSCASSGDYQRINQIAPTIIRLLEDGGTQAEFYGKPYNPYAHVLGIWGMAGECAGTSSTARDCVRKRYHLPAKSITGLPWGE